MTRDSAYDSGLIVGLCDGENCIELKEGLAADSAIRRVRDFNVPDDFRHIWQLGYVDGFVRGAKEAR